MKYIAILAVVVCGVFLSACSKEARQAKGFVLPKGNIDNGKSEFVNLGCHECHTVAKVELAAASKTSAVSFALGGEVRRVKSYGELVTSIIQPQHVIDPKYVRTLEEEQKADAQSPMPSFNDKMNVSQLIDIVTFLNSHYVRLQPTYEDYHYMP